jgi:hypothetical protein
VDSRQRKPLVFAIAIGIVAACAYYYASGLFPKYEYRSDIFLGEFAADNSFQPLEPPVSTEFFVRDTLLIAPTTDELTRLGVTDMRSSVLVTVIEAGKSLRIRTTAAEADVARIKAIHQFVADRILDRLRGRAGYVKARLESRLSEAQESLQFLTHILAIVSEIGSNAKANEARVQELARKLDDEISKHDRSQQGSSPPAAAAEGEGLGLSRRGQLAMYQKLGLAEIPLLRATSAKTIIDLEQSAARSRQVIKDLNEQLAVFREPAVTQFALRSVSSVGSSRLLTLLVGLVAGFMAYLAAWAVQKGLSSK